MAEELFIGVLSGTSIDAVDAALVRFAPQPGLVAVHGLKFPAALRQELLALCVPGDGEIDRMCGADVEVGRLFARAVRELLEKAGVAPGGVRAIGSHGQTIRHRPGRAPAFTLQIGDPNIIAAGTGITVAADFRRMDMAFGGQGAPLVPAFHAAVFRSARADRVVANIGGVANITVLPADPSAKVLGFDTGPGNTLLDAWCRESLGEPMDTDGRFASSGRVHAALLDALLADPFFARRPPKSTGPEYFSMEWLKRHLAANPGIAAPDVQATLLELTSRTLADEIARLCGGRAQEVYLCGGGANNPALVRSIRALLPGCRVGRTDDLGVPVDWVEAMAFAWLARQRVLGLPGNLPAVTGASREAVLGSLHLPA